MLISWYISSVHVDQRDVGQIWTLFDSSVFLTKNMVDNDVVFCCCTI